MRSSTISSSSGRDSRLARTAATAAAIARSRCNSSLAPSRRLANSGPTAVSSGRAADTGLVGEGLVVAAMMARMAAERVQTGRGVTQLRGLVDAYARRGSPAVLDQQADGSVSSALGVWLLLAACASGAKGSERAALEEALGCSAGDAIRLLTAFMADPPTALHAAIALWVAVDDATADLSAWTRGLPDEIESGFMPTPAQADAWAARETLGLIRHFPAKIDKDTRIVLASALATKVKWEVPFDVVPAAQHYGSAS